jgi:pimeloyl-ACP methyl ester carboxylesterase
MNLNRFVVSEFSNLPDPMAAKFTARGTLAMLRFHEAESLPQITVPTLVVVDKSDIATRPFASQRIRQEIPQTELAVLAPRGHMGLMERNQQFAEAIRSFSAACFGLKR